MEPGTIASRRLLVVDDSPDVCDQLRAILESDGYQVEACSSGNRALERLLVETFHLVITDLRMPDLDGMELLQHLRRRQYPCGIVVLTGFGDSRIALEAMKSGADDFLTKPIEGDRLRIVVPRVLERRELLDELVRLREEMDREHMFSGIVSKNHEMRRIFDLIERIGPLGSTVLISGETGTGKELVARAIHDCDTHRKGPFLAVNCAAINEALFESELFGHEPGAFTSANQLRRGRFELADGGTLFLDEIGEVPLSVQPKLLRILQSGQFERIGGEETHEVDVRILAATNRRLEDEREAGTFRSDLYYRLNVIHIELPPLRDRKEDIPLLATYFLNKTSASRSELVDNQIDHETMNALLRYDWPGNVRELENAISSAVALTTGSVVRTDALPRSIVPNSDDPPPRIDAEELIRLDMSLPDLSLDLITRVERDYFIRLLKRYQGNVAQCARHSRLSRQSVTQKLQKLELDSHLFRPRRNDSAPRPSF